MQGEEKALARKISDHFDTGAGALAVHKLLDGEGHNVLIIEGDKMKDIEVSGLSYLCSEVIKHCQRQLDRYVVLNWFCGVRDNEYECVETMLRSLLGQLQNRFTEPPNQDPPIEFNGLINTLWQEILTMLLSTDIVCIIDHVQRYETAAEKEAMKEALGTLIAIAENICGTVTNKHSFRLLITSTNKAIPSEVVHFDYNVVQRYLLSKEVVEVAQIKAEEETRGRSPPKPL